MRHTLALRRAPRSFFNLISDFDELLTPPRPMTHESEESQMAWFNPATDVEERPETFLITFDLPGVKKEDVKIDLHENLLTVKGERVKVGHFERRFSLPQGVDSDKTEAHFEDGVLSIVIPKRETAKAKTIEIQSKSH